MAGKADVCGTDGADETRAAARTAGDWHRASPGCGDHRSRRLAGRLQFLRLGHQRGDLGPPGLHRADGTASAAAAAASFVNIVEPFDPGHPARTEPAPASCSQSATIAIERCYEVKTENTDVTIDSFQFARYQSASPAQRVMILAQDRAWLAAREPVCAAAFNTGGTIDGISTAACLLDESTARLYAVRGVAVPVAELRGHRQHHSSFTDAGLVEPPDPAYHRVPAGREYQFSIDYSTLSKDPNANKSAAGYLYAPGTPVAVWR